MYVARRCVFKLIGGGLLLTEIAPGIDLQRDTLERMDFCPLVNESLERMPAGIFNENWGGLKKIMDKE